MARDVIDVDKGDITKWFIVEDLVPSDDSIYVFCYHISRMKQYTTSWKCTLMTDMSDSDIIKLIQVDAQLYWDLSYAGILSDPVRRAYTVLYAL